MDDGMATWRRQWRRESMPLGGGGGGSSYSHTVQDLSRSIAVGIWKKA